jgi:multiple sugar transport system permease protein
LGSPSLALPVIVLITAGKVVGLNVLLYGAALSKVDRRVLEAARVDGASERQVTWRVIVPQLARTMVVLTLLGVLLAGQWAFTNIAVLTQGGPGGATDSVYFRIYTYAFEFFDTGAASAAAVLVVTVLAAVLVLSSRLRRPA